MKNINKTLSLSLLVALLSGCNGNIQSIENVRKTYSNGNEDTYTIIYENGKSIPFTIINGADGQDGIKGVSGTNGSNPIITISKDGTWVINGTDSNVRVTPIDGIDGKDGLPGVKGDQGIPGIPGKKGEKGDKGADGIDGINGTDGIDGVTTIKGTSNPTNLIGNDGDYYLNIESKDLFFKEAGEWILKSNLIGQDGDSGLDGQDGVEYIPIMFEDEDGSTIYQDYCIKGELPQYNGPIPTKEIINGRKYTFDKWDDSFLNPVNEFSTFVASYTFDFTYEFGSYPQSLVKDSNLIQELDKIEEINAYGYIEYDGFYYYPYSGVAYVDNEGNEVSEGMHYYLVEPIIWQTYGNYDDGGFMGFARDVLDAYQFNSNCYEGLVDEKYANNYAASSIRDWLNEDFINQAYFKEEMEMYFSRVSNESSSTGYTDHPYACENTEDLAFIPSLNEILVTGLQYINENTVQCEARSTEFARARGLYGTIDNNFLAKYWLRTPSYTEENKAIYIEGFDIHSLVITTESVDEYLGVRPAVSFVNLGGN